MTYDTFPKTVTKGDAQAPLYKALTTQADPAGDVKWNFEKFLIGKDGQVAARFMTRTTPEDPQVVKAIEAALAK